jgi:tetratricopeptide (TPR) repeat protein
MHLLLLFLAGCLGTGTIGSQTPVADGKGIASRLYLALDLERRGMLLEAEQLLLGMIPPAKQDEIPLLTTAVALNNLAVIYSTTERYADAERCLRRSIRILILIPGEETGDLLTRAKLALASLYVDMQRMPEAHRIVSPAFVKDLAGTANRIRAEALLASLVVRRRDLVTAEKMYLHVLTELRATPGTANDKEIPEKTATVLNNLAMIALKQGRIPLARSRMDESVAAWKNIVGDESPVLAKVLSNFGVVCMKAKQYDEAARLFSRN